MFIAEEIVHLRINGNSKFNPGNEEEFTLIISSY